MARLDTKYLVTFGTTNQQSHGVFNTLDEAYASARKCALNTLATPYSIWELKQILRHKPTVEVDSIDE